MVVRERVRGRDVDDIVVDLVDVEAVGGRTVGVVDVAGEIDRTLAQEVEEGVAIAARHHVRPDITESQRRIEVGADAVVAVDVIVRTAWVDEGELAGEDVDARGRTDRAEAVDAGHVGPVAGAGQVDHVGEGEAARQFEGGGHAADVELAGGELVGGGDLDGACVDVELAGPAGVVGAEDEGAGRLLDERGGRAAGEFKGRGQRDGLAGGDFELAGVGRVAEDDRASEGQVVGETQRRVAAGRRQDDLVGGVAELAVGRDREHAALDVHVADEVIGGVAEHEGAVAGLREAGAGDLAREGQALGDVMERGARDGEDRVGGDGQRLVDPQSVPVVVRQREARAEVRDDARGDGLIEGLVERQGAAGAADGDVRDDAGVEDDRAREDDGLRLGAAVAVREERDRGGVAEGGGVEVARVAGGIEDQLAEALDLERGDVADVRDLAEHGHHEVRAVDADRGDAAGLADGEGAVEREGAAGGAGVVEGGQAGEGQVVADRAVVVVDEERGAGRERGGTGAERAGGEAVAALEGRAVGADDDAARGDGEAAREGVLAAELEEAVAGLGDGDAEADDVGRDVEGRGQFGVDRGLTGQADAGDIEDVGARGEGEAAARDAGGDARVAGGRGDRGQARERKDAVRAGADVGEVGTAVFAAGVVERQAGEGVDGVVRERQAAGAVDRDAVGRGDGALREDVHPREEAGLAAVDGHAAGRDDDGAVGGGGDVDLALVDDGAAGVGVGGGEGEDAVARLGQADGIAGAVVGDDGVDDEIAHAERPALVGLGGDGRTGDRDLGRAVDGDDERADRDTRAGDDHAGADARGGTHRDDGRTARRGAGVVRADVDATVGGVGGERVGADGDLGVGVHRDDGRAGGEIGRAADDHARTEAPGVHAGDDGRPADRGRSRAAVRQTPGLVEDDEFAHARSLVAAGGEHAAVRQVADDAVEGVVAAEETAVLEVEDVGGSGEGHAVGSTARELEHRGGGAAGRQRGDGVLHGDELGRLAGAEVAVITDETALPHHADAVDRIVSGVVVIVGDGPRAEDAVGLRGQRRVEEDAGDRTAHAEIGAGEVERRAGRAGQRGEAHRRGDEVAAAVVGGERIAAFGQGERAEAFADVLAGEAGVDEDTAAHGDRGRVVDAVIVHELGVTVGVHRERRIVQDELGGIEEGAVVLEGVGAAHEGRDAAVAEGAGHGERVAADAAEIDVRAGGRAVEADGGAREVGHEVAGAGRAGDEAAAVDLAAVREVTDELGEAVEVERAAEGVHEILLTGAVDGVRKAELDRAARDIRRAAVVLAVVQQQGARAHLDEGGARGNLPGQVDGHAVHDLEVTDLGRGGAAEFETRHREHVGDGRSADVAAEEQAAGSEGKGRELRAGDIARGRVGDGEGVQGRTHRGEVVGRIGRGDLRGRGRDEGGIGQRGGRGVVREGDDAVGAESRKVVGGEQDAGVESADNIGVRRSGGEPDLVGRAEAADAGKVEHRGGVLVGDRSEREDVGTGAGHQDAARAFVDAQGARGLIRAGGVADEAEKTAVDEGDGAAGDTAGADVLGGVVEGELGLVADAHARADARAQGVERARAADDGETAIHAEFAAEGVGGGQVERADAAEVERAAGRGAAAVDDRGGDIGRAGPLHDEDAVGRVVGQLDAAGEVQRAGAGDVVEQVAVAVVVADGPRDLDGVRADEAGGLAVEVHEVGDAVGAREHEASRAGDGTALEFEGAGAERAGLGELEPALIKNHAAGMGVGRVPFEPDDGAVGHRNRETGDRIHGQPVADDAVPDRRRTLAADAQRAGGGRAVGLPADVIAVDREDRAALEAVAERDVVAAIDLVEVLVDGDRVEPREAARAVVVDDDRLVDDEPGRVGAEDGAVAEHQAAEDDRAAGGHVPVAGGGDGEGGGIGDRGDGIPEAEAGSIDVGTDGETRGIPRGQRDGLGVGDDVDGAAGVGLQAHGRGTGEAKGTALDVSPAGVGISTSEDPEALVALVDTQRLVGRRVGQDRGDGIEVGVDAAELDLAVIRRGEGREAVGRTGVDDVRQGQRTGAAGLDAAGTGRAGEVDRAGGGLARTSVGQRDGIGAAGITEFEPAAGDVVAEGRGRGAGGADGRDDELLRTQDGVAGVGVGVAEEQRTPALLGEIARAGDDAGDGREVEAGEAVVVDDDVAEAPAGDRQSDAGGDGGDGPAEIDLGLGVVTRDIGASGDAGPRDELADREQGGVAAREPDGRRIGAGFGGGEHAGGDGRIRADLEITADLDVGQGVAGVEGERGTLQEVRGAVGVAPDQVLTRPVDDEFGAVGGEAGETGDRAGLPLAVRRAGPKGAVENTAGLEEGIARPIPAKAQVGGDGQRSTVDGDERAALDVGRARISVVLVT